MKSLIIILLIFPLISFSQEMSETINVDQNKTSLFSHALEWAAITFKSANDVVQMKDQESGIIILKGILYSTPKNWGVTVLGNTWVTITIKVKDNTYKYEYSQIKFVAPNGGNAWYWDEQPKMARKPWLKWKEDVVIELNDVTNKLKAAMVKSNEW